MAGFDAEEATIMDIAQLSKELYQFDKPETALAIGGQYVDDVVYPLSEYLQVSSVVSTSMTTLANIYLSSTFVMMVHSSNRS